jgi:hypothetical protein
LIAGSRCLPRTLAPLRTANSFSFVRDFEIGRRVFCPRQQLTPMRTDNRPESELGHYLEELNMTGGLDIFF